MRSRLAVATVAALGAGLAALAFAPAAALAQMGGGAQSTTRDTARRVWVVPGERAGPSAFPLTNYPEVQPKVAGQLDWEHYHTSEEIETWMRRWAEQYPELTELYVAGETFGGRPVWQMTLTNERTGRHTDKPAAFFEGGRHSGEITSTESAFYLLWYLLDRYGKDTAVTRLLDTKAVYIRPLNNPDGSDMYRLTAQTNRSSVRPHDTDRDGLLDEDPGEDLDGDGYVRDMRKFVGRGKGDFDPDPRDRQGRLMRRVGTGQGSWMVYPEGVDNDGDGRYNEDGVGGLDLHRNYPTNWRPEPGEDSTGRGNTQFGAGAYPLSEPETRSVVMWMYQHPNISVVNTMDTAVPMHLRPPSTCESAECMFPADLALYQHFDSAGLSFTRYPWAGDVYRTYATRVPVNPFTGDTARPSALFGHSPDFGYFGYGAIWYGDELWNGGRERDYDGNGVIEQWEVLRYCDEEFAGRCFQKWTKVQHPVLGEVEVGGFNPKFWSQNGPPEVMGEWARRQAMFNLYMAQSLPQLEIVDAQVAAAPAGAADSATHVLTVTVRNSGRIPTALEQAKRIRIVEPDRVTLVAPRGAGVRTLGRPEEFFLGGGETRTVTIRLRAAGDARTATVRAASTRGGVAEREVRW